MRDIVVFAFDFLTVLAGASPARLPTSGASRDRAA